MNTENLTNLAYYAIAGGVTLLVLAGLFVLAWRLFKLFKAEAEGQTGAEQGLSLRAIRNLNSVLAEAEKDSDRASALILDAQTYAQTLVDLAQGIALKAEDMSRDIEDLNVALAAIADRDPLKIARAGGMVKDQHIRTLLLGKVHTEGYWHDTAMLISAQVGTLSQWERGYRVFASNLLAEVSKAKAQIAALDATLEMTGISRPLLQTQASLQQAAGYLQLQRHPGLHQAAKEIPAVNAGLMLR